MAAKSGRRAACVTRDDPYRILAHEIRTREWRPSAHALEITLAEALCRKDVVIGEATAGLGELAAALQAELGGRRLAAVIADVSAERRDAMQEEHDLTGADAACDRPLRHRLLEELRCGPLSATELAVGLGCSAGIVEQLSETLSSEWLVLPLDDPLQGERVYVLSLQGAHWIDRHLAYGPNADPPEVTSAAGGVADSRAAMAPREELPVAGQPLALVAQASGWSVVPSYFAAVSAHLPPDTVESRATMAFAALIWCNGHGFHRRGFNMRSLAEAALAEALADDPPQWADRARRTSAGNQWPPTDDRRG